MATTDEIDAYVNTQLSISDIRTKNAITNRITGLRYPRRSAILKLEKALRGFQAGLDPRWIAVLGLRGVGKTTMISQLFQIVRCPKGYKVFVAMDDAKDTLDIGIKEITQSYERTLGMSFEELTQPVYLFIDEVHFDQNWAQSLKPLVDRSPYIFVIMTGSSVSEINRALDSDTARRVLTETLHPMSFTEYLLLKRGKNMGASRGVGASIRKLIYEGGSLDEIHQGLENLRPKVMTYWLSIPPNERQKEIDRYMRYANLPFTLTYADNEEYIYQQIAQILSTIINKDIRATGNFDNVTIAKIRPILYAIANSSTISINKISNDHTIDRTVLSRVLVALEKSSVLQRVYPYAQHSKQTTKPSKYLFVSSAYRSMFFNFIGSTIPYDAYKGLLLEDTVNLYLSILTRQGLSSLEGGLGITYDSASIGADFILSADSKKICIEVGYGQKKPTQANMTTVRHKCMYGITVSSSPLKRNSSSITVPLSYFLLTA